MNAGGGEPSARTINLGLFDITENAVIGGFFTGASNRKAVVAVNKA